MPCATTTISGCCPNRSAGPTDTGTTGCGTRSRSRGCSRLTELGLGLDEVRDVLADDAGRELHEVLDELDADLARQEEELRVRRARLAAVRRQAAEHGGLPAEGPVSDELAALFAEMARTSAARPGPEPAVASKEREVLALLESMGGEEGSKRMVELLGETTAAPGAMERAYEVYGLLDALVDAGTDDPRVEEAARALADCIPDSLIAEVSTDDWARAAAPGAETDGGFLAAYYAHFAPAQARAVRRAIQLVAERAR